MGDQASDLESLERILGDASAEPTRLSYALMKSITNDFSQEIGRGGFGVVYLGTLPSGKVAVKKLTIAQDFSDKRFRDEVNCLMRAKHNNIVRFLGYCADTQGELMEHNGRNVMAEVRQRLLCFEYVPNGSLQHYLKEKPHGNEWKIRYQMIKGVCQGLQYLHKERINHLDLKLENVLLDAHMEPRITDFGLSRSFDEEQSRIFTKSTAGTRGYIAPEIIDKGEISFKSDIFSLGIIIIKLLTGSDNNDIDNWNKSIDTDGPEVKSCIEIARTCVDADQHNRPYIDEIIHKLNEMEIVQESRNDPAGPFMYQNKVCPSAPNKLNQDTEKTKPETSKLQFSAHMDHPRDVGGKCDAQMVPPPQPQHQAATPMRVDPKTVKFSLPEPEDDGGSKLDDEPDDGADKDGPKTRLVGMAPNAAGVDEKGGNGVGGQPTGSNNSGRGEKVNGIGDPAIGVGGPVNRILPPSPLQTMTRPNMVGSAGFPGVGPTGHPQMGGRNVQGMAAGGLPPTGFYQGGGGGGGPGSMPAGVENLRAAAAAGNPMALQQFVALIQHHQHQHQHHQQQIHMILMNGGHGGAGYPQMGYRPPVSYPMTPHLQQTQVKPPPHLQPAQVKPPPPPQFPVALRPVQPPPEDDFSFDDDDDDEFDDDEFDDDEFDDGEEDARESNDDDGRLYNEARPRNARGGTVHEIPLPTRENNNGSRKYEVLGPTNTINRGIAPTGRSHSVVAAPGSMGGDRMLHQLAMMRPPNTMGGRRWAVDRSVQGVPTVCVSPALHLGSEGGAPSGREMRQVAVAAENSMAMQQQFMALIQRQQMAFNLFLFSFLFALTIIIIITVKARRSNSESGGGSIGGFHFWWCSSRAES